MSDYDYGKGHSVIELSIRVTSLLRFLKNVEKKKKKCRDLRLCDVFGNVMHIL